MSVPVDSSAGSVWLPKALGLREGEAAFPWQLELLRRFCAGEPVSALDIPTGLGKTAVMAIWLVARALGANVPRRLVYVVDRRAVVDQATTEAEQLREWVKSDDDVRAKLGLGEKQLPISTLRGQHIDNREWLEDPSVPAIIVGTVDMVGSRLLFEGYGVSRNTRSLHAALMGVDSLLVLDEAHLSPAFEDLVRGIADKQFDGMRADIVPPRVKLLPLSATQRASTDAVLSLTKEDEKNAEVAKRLNAEKWMVTVHEVTRRLRTRRAAAEATAMAPSSPCDGHAARV